MEKIIVGIAKKIKVRATEDIYNYSKTRILAKKGRVGEVLEDWAGAVGSTIHVDVVWEGNKTRTSTPGWLLEEIISTEK